MMYMLVVIKPQNWILGKNAKINLVHEQLNNNIFSNIPVTKYTPECMLVSQRELAKLTYLMST